MAEKQLTEIPGIGPATAKTLSESGFSTVDDIARASTVSLATVPGFGEARAAAVITAAQSLLAAEASPGDLQESTEGKAKKKRKKGGKKKRGKGKDKKKDKKSKKKDKKSKKGKKKDSKKKRKK